MFYVTSQNKVDTAHLSFQGAVEMATILKVTTIKQESRYGTSFWEYMGNKKWVNKRTGVTKMEE